MQARTLQEMYQEHRGQYDTWKKNFDLSQRIFEEGCQNESGRLILEGGNLLLWFSPSVGQLENISDSIDKMVSEIQQGKYDGADEFKDDEPFLLARNIHHDILILQEKFDVLQLIQESKVHNPDLYEKIIQYTFSNLEQKPPAINDQQPLSPWEKIEQTFKFFDENNETLRNGLKDLQGKADGMTACLKERMQVTGIVEGFRQAVYHGSIVKLSQAKTIALFAQPSATEENAEDLRKLSAYAHGQ